MLSPGMSDSHAPPLSFSNDTGFSLFLIKECSVIGTVSAPTTPSVSMPPVSQRSIPFTPTEDDLARLLPPSLHGPVTFHGWAPIAQPILILRHLPSNRILYIGLDGREYRFKPFADYGGQVTSGAPHGRHGSR